MLHSGRRLLVLAALTVTACGGVVTSDPEGGDGWGLGGLNDGGSGLAPGDGGTGGRATGGASSGGAPYGVGGWTPGLGGRVGLGGWIPGLGGAMGLGGWYPPGLGGAVGVGGWRPGVGGAIGIGGWIPGLGGAFPGGTGGWWSGGTSPGGTSPGGTGGWWVGGSGGVVPMGGSAGAPPTCERPCHDNATCRYDLAPPICVCNPGYVGDGYSCEPADPCNPQPVRFSKANHADPWLPQNQDCLAPGVCLTRGDYGPLYNAAVSDHATEYCNDQDPVGTRWAWGACETTSPSDFGSLFTDVAGCYPPGLVGVPLCLLIPATGQAFNITFSSWTSGGMGPGGGGFTYVRTPVPCGLMDAQCLVTPDGRYTCDCPPGYEVNTSSLLCVDIDECARGTHTCDPSAICQNSPGSFGCVCSSVQFSKPDWVPWSDPAAQDCISPNVCITRDFQQPLFNAVLESSHSGSCSGIAPRGTEWALVPCAAADPWDFGPFIGETFAQCSPPSIVGVPGCLHLTFDDLYFDIVFSQWTQGGNGGGFTYTRSVVVPPGGVCE